MERARVFSGGRLGAAVLLLLIVLTLATARGGDASLYPPAPGKGVAIYLVDNGFHSDVVAPREALMAYGGPIAKATALTTTDPWVTIGWGDARFYEEQTPWQGRILDGVRALFGGRPTIVHLEGVAGDPMHAWRDVTVRRIWLTPEGLRALVRRADRAFALGPDGGPIVAPVAHDPAEGFFKSGERFSLFHLCNHWTAELLNAAGLPTTPVLDTLTEGLALDLRLRANVR